MRYLFVVVVFCCLCFPTLATDLATSEGSPVRNIFVNHITTLEIQRQSLERYPERHTQQRQLVLDQIKRGTISGETRSIKQRILEALWAFEVCGHPRLDRYEKLYRNVPRKQKKLLDHAIAYGQGFSELKPLRLANKVICKSIVNSALDYYHLSRRELDVFIRGQESAGKQADHESVSQALKLFVRDWATEGLNERQHGFQCIKDHLELYISPHEAANAKQVLVPGAGYGRLAHEIANMQGTRYSVTTNEWSAYVNAAYHVLETDHSIHIFYPFIELTWSHLLTKNEMRRQISFPDVPIDRSAVFLVEGDFTKVLQGHTAAFDAVITLFFIDTARNLINYFDTIHRLLKPGGIWINFGPLLYSTSPWVQLSLEEIITVTQNMGFEFLPTSKKCGDISIPGQLVRGMEALYNFNTSSLSKYAYIAQFWVARKL